MNDHGKNGRRNPDAPKGGIDDARREWADNGRPDGDNQKPCSG